jgi:polyisoprenoid-binding protein YceI
VHFKVDSTWHLVEGSTAGIEGNAWLADPTDELSVRATINFPVARFSTGGGMRDERMREVMDEEHSHYVTLAVDSLTPKCSEQKFQQTRECTVDVHSRLSIRGSERSMLLKGRLRGTTEAIEFSGEVEFSWLDFGVEDPSILIAKLEPTLRVEYWVRLPRAVVNSKNTP